jgi:penicillin-binding protein 1A
VSLKWGITNSSNNISAYLMKQFGPHAMVAMMRRMGIMSHVDAVPALCVGPADIALWDMVAAYNTFPSKGVFIEPLFVTRIEDSQGNVLSEFSNRKTEAISDATAYLMVNLMKGVVEEGTAQRLRSRYNLTGEMAGKTGTTNDNSDGWFIGYTPTIVAGCWTGCEDRQVHFQSTALGQGANASLPTWAFFMKKVWADGTLGVTRDDKFSAPAGMEGSDGCEGGGDGGASVSVAQERIEDYYFE